MISELEEQHSIKRLCTVLKCSPSAYYSWRSGSSQRREGHRHFGPENLIAKGFDQVAIQLAHARTIKLALFNAAAVCVYATHLPVETDIQDFNGWLFQVYNADDHRNPVKNSV